MAKTTDFLETLLGNPARAKILRLFVLNDTMLFAPAEIAKRAGVSTRVSDKEITALKKMGIVKKEMAHVGKGASAAAKKRAIRYGADPMCKHFSALATFIHEVSPEEFNDVEQSLRRTGRLSVLVLSGMFTGDTTRPADILVAGDFGSDERFVRAVKALETRYGREIRYALFSTPEFRYRLTIKDRIVRDVLDYPHRVLVDKHRLVRE